MPLPWRCQIPRNGSGSYSLTSADNPNVAGASISSSKMNNTLNDIAAALTASICADGQTTITANLPMSTYKHTNVGDGVNLTDYASIKNVQNGTPIWCGTAGGSANALTLSCSPATTAYVAGQTFRFVSASANTTASTVAVSGLATKAIQANGMALVANDILSGKLYEITYDGTAFQLVSDSNRTINNPTVGGLLTYATIPACSATLSGVQSIPNNTVTRIAFDTKSYDNLSELDIVTNKGRYTATNAGIYDIRATTEWVSAPTAATIGIYKNGSTTYTFFNNTAQSASVSGVIKLVATDYIEIAVFQNSGGAINLNAAVFCWLQITRIGG